MNDLDAYQAVWRFDRDFRVQKSAQMMQNETGVKPRYLVIHPSICDRYFGGNVPIEMFCLTVQMDPRCPEDSVYFSDTMAVR